MAERTFTYPIQHFRMGKVCNFILVHTTQLNNEGFIRNVLWSGGAVQLSVSVVDPSIISIQFVSNQNTN